MPQNLRVVVDLQWQQEPAVRALRRDQLFHHLVVSAPVKGLANTAPQPLGCFRPWRHFPVMDGMRVAPVCGGHCQAISCCDCRHPVEFLSGRYGFLNRRQHVPRKSVVEGSVPRDRRVSIDAADFEGHVVRAHVAFLAHEEPNAHLLCNFSHWQMYRTILPEQDDGGDPVPGDECRQPARPFLQASVEGKCVAFAVEDFISAVEIDLENFLSMLDQVARKLAEEGTHRALQEQRAAVLEQGGEGGGMEHGPVKTDGRLLGDQKLWTSPTLRIP